MKAGIFGLERDGLVVGRQRLVVALLLCQDDALAVPRIGELGVECDCFFEEGKGVFHVVL